MSTQIIRPPAFQRPSGRMYLFAVQNNIADGSWVDIVLNAVSADFKDGIEDIANHRIVVDVAGFYFVNGQISLKEAPVNIQYSVRITKNAAAICLAVLHNRDLLILRRNFSNIIYCSAGDIFEMSVYSADATNATDIQGGENETYLAVQRVR